MARGPIVTAKVESLIALVYQKHPKWRAPEVRNEVSHILRQNNSKLPSGWPSLSTVQKVLATVRRKMKETTGDPEGKPWSMGTLNEYPIPPDVIPAVIGVGKFRVAREEYFTVRDAKWAARLSGLIKDIRELSKEVGCYARLESLYQLVEQPMDSTSFDQGLMGIPLVPIGKDDLEANLNMLSWREDGIEQMREFLQDKREDFNLDRTEKTKGKMSARPLKELAEEIEIWESYKKEAKDERTHSKEVQE